MAIQLYNLTSRKQTLLSGGRAYQFESRGSAGVPPRVAADACKRYPKIYTMKQTEAGAVKMDGWRSRLPALVEMSTPMLMEAAYHLSGKGIAKATLRRLSPEQLVDVCQRLGDGEGVEAVAEAIAVAEAGGAKQSEQGESGESVVEVLELSDLGDDEEDEDDEDE